MGGFGRSRVQRLRPPRPRSGISQDELRMPAEGYAGATQPASTFLVVTAPAGPGMLMGVNVIASMPERSLAIKCRGLTENCTIACSAYFAIRRHIPCIQSG